ncbi:MAG: ATP synthase F1 subunit epsilon [Nitrospinae bacterium CG11_big_fil_rev_8_21_14_0_20_56_8]|nr:MAG: ATP synthase F1 subunit epsilon [Nitrospinae bacterium CG11_big_fil_rev_8_21_14_0_20_56_8]
MSLLQLSIVTPQRLIVSDQVDQVNIPGTEGDLGILYDHAPILTGMRSGQLSYQKEGQTIVLIVSGGYVEVTENRVTVLAETAEFLDEIDRGRAEAARQKAEELLNRADLTDEEFHTAQKKLFRAIARLEGTESSH